MNTNQIVDELLQEAEHTLKLVPLSQRELFIEEMEKHIHSFSRKLIESLAEEIKDNNPFVHECGKENGCDICLKEEGYRTVEDKMKEIITNLK